jgi:hypothetical protein
MVEEECTCQLRMGDDYVHCRNCLYCVSVLEILIACGKSDVPYLHGALVPASVFRLLFYGISQR